MYRESIYSNASTPLGEMPPPNQQNLWPGPPPTHPYQYSPPTQEPNNRYSQAYSPQYAYHNQPPQTSGTYVQPHYGATSAPSFIAELPAPLPPAPPTTTPQQQLTEDERLAHKIQQMELEEARKRSSTIGSTVSQQHSPPTPHLGTHSPRPHSHSFSSASTYHPQPSGLPPLQGTPSLLPEVVQGPRPVSFHEAARPHSQVGPPSPGPHFAPHLPPAPTDPSSLSAYLEHHRQVPYPPQWRLAPIVATFYASSTPASKSDWLDIPESRSWRTVRFSENARNPTPPSFLFHFKSKGGSFRDPRFMWTMTCGNGKKDKISKVQYPTWTYELRLDRNTGKRKTESLAHAKGRDMLTTFVHALNYDSLRFIGPDGRAYMWVSHAPVSSVNGARYDTLRHALFVSTETARDPLFGQIIADHTHWDGFVDTAEVHTGTTCAGCNASPINGLRWVCRTCPSHNLCEVCCKANVSNTIEPSCDMSLVSLPDEALYIRSTHVDPALVVASLQVLKDWEMHTIREQRTKDPRGFDISVEKARQYDLGRMSYWRPGDLDTKATDAKFGTVIKAKECMQAAAEVASALGNLAEPIFDASGGDGGGGGGGDGGGGGGGGGDGGGGGGGGA